MTRRDFFSKAAKHWWVAAAGSVAVLKYQAKVAVNDIEKLENRVSTLQNEVSELKGYNDAFYRTMQKGG